ncbi:DUF1906 domain-containing protein [Pullulanibacillus sp. KACC 23026]|uniref:glycoside hydrolase domain-containing protein n=1 Tax=Pullulanibacillus sp. KACC 23026 TaxID=3028315 RepID=UPI0023B1E581|nr:glycoside hydrolase domain-containing protein [Pullulanibacillus sp. KACC 23026]WEG10921.1 DUF1906 domain-containing protein [Pullulanibacillus sp. KACC 23026]
MLDRSRWFQWWAWLIAVILVVGLIWLSFWSVKQAQPSGGSTSGSSSNPKIAWGIDTTSKINSSFYQCVSSNYGDPDFVGRYMTTKSGVYSGLSKSEVTYLHDKKIKILPIYNQFTNAKGSKQGTDVAQKAINRAKDLGIPKGTVIAADIEKGDPINSAFIISWTKTMEDAGYKAGLYGNLPNSPLKTAYTDAENQSKAVKNDLILWSNQPSGDTTTKSKAPTSFKADSPNQSQTFVWQYGLEGKKCNVDTDLMKGNLLNNLW